MSREREDGQPQTPVTYRSVWSTALFAAPCVVFFFLGVAMMLSSDSEAISEGGRVLGFITAVLFGPLTLRAIRAGVIVTGDDVVLRSLFRTRRVAWDEISVFEVGGSWSVVPWQTLTVKRTDGTTITADAVSSLPLRHPTFVERSVEALNEQHRRLGSTPTPQNDRRS
jgi:hypothetical protein